MSIPQEMFSRWLANVLFSRIIGVVLGSVDERVLNRIARDAVIRTARLVGAPGASDDTFARIAECLDECFAPHKLLAAPSETPSDSILAAFQTAARAQMQGLYEETGTHKTTAAQALDLTVSVDELISILMKQLAFAIGCAAPQHASVLQAFRHEVLLVTASATPRTESAAQIEFRYFICRELDALADLLSYRFDRLPFGAPLLHENVVSAYWRHILHLNSGDHRLTELHGRSFAALDDYRRQFADAESPSPADGLPSYELLRPAAADDIEQFILPQDAITRILIQHGAKPADVALAVVHYELCGPRQGFPYQESFLLRPAWGLLLQVSIVGDTSITLNEWFCTSPTTMLASFPPNSNEEPCTPEALPAVPIGANQSVILPLATLVPRLPPPAESCYVLSDDDLGDAQVQTVGLTSTTAPPLRLESLGPVRMPHEITIQTRGSVVTHDVRPFDPALMYTLSRRWQIGSCPHVFEVQGDGFVRYRGTAFNTEPSREQLFRLSITPGTRFIAVAELEDETTHIRTATLNGQFIIGGQVLCRGDILVLPVEQSPCDLELRGFYVPNDMVSAEPGTFLRNAAVRDLLASSRLPRIASGEFSCARLVP